MTWCDHHCSRVGDMPSKVYLELNKHFISEKSLQNTCTHQAHFFCSWCQNWHAIQSHGKQWVHLECSSKPSKLFQLLCSFPSTAWTYKQEKTSLLAEERCKMSSCHGEFNMSKYLICKPVLQLLVFVCLELTYALHKKRWLLKSSGIL